MFCTVFRRKLYVGSAFVVNLSMYVILSDTNVSLLKFSRIIVTRGCVFQSMVPCLLFQSTYPACLHFCFLFVCHLNLRPNSGIGLREVHTPTEGSARVDWTVGSAHTDWIEVSAHIDWTEGNTHADWTEVVIAFYVRYTACRTFLRLSQAITLFVVEIHGRRLFTDIDINLLILGF